VKSTVEEDDLAMGWLCEQLNICTGKGQILELGEVLKQYEILCQESNKNIPSLFVSRKSSFKGKS